jgi:hypothetical protein
MYFMVGAPLDCASEWARVHRQVGAHRLFST